MSQACLDSPLSTVEITHTIKAMQSGKAPGPDGFPVEFYKVFAVKLTPFFKWMYGEAFSDEKLPKTLSQATNGYGIHGLAGILRRPL